jgi:hypothetical protein
VCAELTRLADGPVRVLDRREPLVEFGERPVDPFGDPDLIVSLLKQAVSRRIAHLPAEQRDVALLGAELVLHASRGRAPASVVALVTVTVQRLHAVSKPPLFACETTVSIVQTGLHGVERAVLLAHPLSERLAEWSLDPRGGSTLTVESLADVDERAVLFAELFAKPSEGLLLRTQL